MILKKSFLRIFLSVTFIALGALAIFSANAANNLPVTVLNIKGAITPAYSDYLHRGLREAKKNNSQLVLIELDTPGGVLTT
ncbi:MAG: nodulation protein NfeD, partial [Pseudomonadota bacterium]|nr:nodulation protein NfeD [Pseudomonadota bacterium]